MGVLSWEQFWSNKTIFQNEYWLGEVIIFLKLILKIAKKYFKPNYKEYILGISWYFINNITLKIFFSSKNFENTLLLFFKNISKLIKIRKSFKKK